MRYLLGVGALVILLSAVTFSVAGNVSRTRYPLNSGGKIFCFTNDGTMSTTSHVTVMGGLGKAPYYANMTISPGFSAIMFSFSATGWNSAAQCGGAVGMVIGDAARVPAPDTGGPLVAPMVPMISMKVFDGAFAGQRVPISFTDYWGYLIPGNTYWFDIDWNTARGGNFTLWHVTMCIQEVG